GTELSAYGHDQNGERCQDQHPAIDEPAEIPQGEKERPLSPVEVLPCERDHPRKSFNRCFRAAFLFLPCGRCRTQKYRGVMEQPIRPGKLKKSIDENDQQAADLDFKNTRGGSGAEGKGGENFSDVRCRSHQCKRAADCQERGGREKGGTILQRAHDLTI